MDNSVTTIGPQEPAVFISAQEASRRFDMSKEWFQARRRQGNGPKFVRIGRAVRYDVQALTDWFRQQAAGGACDD